MLCSLPAGARLKTSLALVLPLFPRRSTLIDRLELLNRQVVGNCSAIVAEGDAAVVAQLVKEAAKAQVGSRECDGYCRSLAWRLAADATAGAPLCCCPALPPSCCACCWERHMSRLLSTLVDRCADKLIAHAHAPHPRPTLCGASSTRLLQCTAP